MPAAGYNILVERGATYSQDFEYKNPDNTPVDLTGATISAKIRKNASDPTVLATFTVVLTDAAAGKWTISMTATTTAGIPVEPSGGPVRRVTPMSWDMKILYPGGTVERLIEGVANVSPQVT